MVKTIQFGQRLLDIPLVCIPDSSLCPVRAFLGMIKLVPANSSDSAFLLTVGSHQKVLTFQIFNLNFVSYWNCAILILLSILLIPFVVGVLRGPFILEYHPN